MAIFRRMAQLGEGPTLTCTLGLTNLTYGGWFIPQADAFLLGTIYFGAAPEDSIVFCEQPSNTIHFIDGVEEDVYEV